MRKIAPALLLSACLPGLPPPGHYAAMNPAPVYSGPTGEVTFTPLSLPPFTLAGAYTAPLVAQPFLMPEVQGSFGFSDASSGYVSLSPALWIVTRPGEVGGHFGLRLGGSIGSGDVLGVYDFYMPYAGPTLHLQYANLGDNGGAFSTTFGGEFLLPFFPDEQSKEGVDDNGTPIAIFPFPVLWVGLDVRGDLPLGERTFLIVGGGFDVGLPLTFIISPNLTVGLRF